MPAGRLVVLRLSGGIDALTYPIVLAAVDTALFGTVEQPTTDLVIDLAGVTFCAIRGLVLLAETATYAARHDVTYALSACPDLLVRHWRYLVARDTTILRYPNAGPP